MDFMEAIQERITLDVHQNVLIVIIVMILIYFCIKVFAKTFNCIFEWLKIVSAVCCGILLSAILLKLMTDDNITKTKEFLEDTNFSDYLEFFSTWISTTWNLLKKQIFSRK